MFLKLFVGTKFYENGQKSRKSQNLIPANFIPLRYFYKECLHIILINSERFHCVKSVRIRSYSGPYFPAFGLRPKIVLFLEIGRVKTFLSLTRPHNGMCIRIYIFNFKKQTHKKEKKREYKKRKRN